MTASMSLMRQLASKTSTSSLTKTLMQQVCTKSTQLVASLQTKATQTATYWLYQEPHIPGRMGLALAVNRLPGQHPRFTHALGRHMVR